LVAKLEQLYTGFDRNPETSSTTTKEKKKKKKKKWAI